MVEDIAAVAQGVDIGMRAEGRGGLAVGVVPVVGIRLSTGRGARLRLPPLWVLGIFACQDRESVFVFW